jgi:hypothetical protein
MRILQGSFSVVVAAAVILGAATADAATRRATPADDLAAILAIAAAGDTIVLGCGTYLQDNLSVPGQVVVRGEGPGADCVVLVSSGQYPVLVFSNVGNSTSVELVTFTMPADVTVASGLRGGAAYLSSSAVTFDGCRFTGLTAVYGGALYCEDGSAPVIINCVFEGNRAKAVGGAVALVGESTAVVDVSLFHANMADGLGGAINAAADSRVSIYSCTFAENGSGAGSSLSAWDNSAIKVRFSIMVDGMPSAWLGDVGSVPSFRCSDVHGNGGGDWVGLLAGQAGASGNISAEPQFCAAAAGVDAFTLSESSPCVAGANAECSIQMGAFPVGCGAAAAPEDLPAVTRLLGNHPNPFNPSTEIAFEIDRAGQVVIEIFDVAGRRIRQLVDSRLPAGAHSATWDGRDAGSRPVAAGVYFYRLETPDTRDVRAMALIK